MYAFVSALDTLLSLRSLQSLKHRQAAVMECPVPVAPASAATSMSLALDVDELVDTDRAANRAQPWRAHWPPKKASTGGAPYGFKKGEKIVIYGN